MTEENSKVQKNFVPLVPRPSATDSIKSLISLNFLDDTSEIGDAFYIAVANLCPNKIVTFVSAHGK